MLIKHGTKGGGVPIVGEGCASWMAHHPLTTRQELLHPSIHPRERGNKRESSEMLLVRWLVITGQCCVGSIGLYLFLLLALWVHANTQKLLFIA